MTSYVMFEWDMRASRLLQILLLLQNRGRMSSRALAEEVEVTPRTILRDVDAMTEAGLPIIVHRGNRGGIELGFNYRTRLTGLAADEAEALGLILAAAPPALAALGLEPAGRRASAKLVESLPETVRVRIALARERFDLAAARAPDDDPRVGALAGAIRARAQVTLRAFGPDAVTGLPLHLKQTGPSWSLSLDSLPDPIGSEDWGHVNISRRKSATALTIP